MKRALLFVFASTAFGAVACQAFLEFGAAPALGTNADGAADGPVTTAGRDAGLVLLRRGESVDVDLGWVPAEGADVVGTGLPTGVTVESARFDGGSPSFVRLRAANDAPFLTTAAEVTLVEPRRDTAAPQEAHVRVLVIGRPGALDRTFGDGGVVVLDCPTKTNGCRLAAVTKDGAGRIVVAGSAPIDEPGDAGAQPRMFAARVLADGRVDDAFGLQVVELDDPRPDQFANAVAVDAKQRIVLWGQSYQGGVSARARAARLLDDGGRDPAFSDTSSGGAISSGQDGEQLAIASKDRPVVSSDTGNGACVERLTESGAQVDPTWAGGRAVDAGVGVVPSCLQVLADDAVVFAGTTADALVAMRLGADGALDPSVNGRISLEGSVDPRTRGCAVDQDGSVVLIATTFDATSGRYVLARIAPTGGLVTSFGDGGVVRVDSASERQIASGLVVQEGGRIVIAGHVRPFTGVPSEGSGIVVVRLEPDGAVDRSFGEQGRTAPISGGTRGASSGIVADDYGRLVVVGHDRPDPDAGLERALVMRFWP